MLKRIGVLVSGGGTNLQAILDAQDAGRIPSGEVVTVIASRAGAFALERARQHNIEGIALERKAYPDREAYDEALLAHLQAAAVDVVVLAGFLCILGPNVIRAYPNRIVNVHPALIPAFCGEGCFGLHVHEKALAYGVKVTGATVHFVNEVTDGGAIIAQKAVAVREDDTPETLQRRVMEEAEWQLLPRAVELLCADRLAVEGRTVKILSE